LVSFEAAARKPMFWGKEPVVAEVAADRSAVEEAASAYLQNRTGAVAELSSPTFGALAVLSEWRHLAAHEFASAAVAGLAGGSFKTALRYRHKTDTRDSSWMPREGSLAAATVELARVADAAPAGRAAAYYARVEGAAQHHVPLAGDDADATLSLSVRSGAMLPLGGGDGESPLVDRFFLGGESLRGFEPRGAGPHDGEDSIGGDAFIAATAAISVPPPARSIFALLPVDTRLQLFVAAGNNVPLSSLRGFFRGTGAESGKGEAGKKGPAEFSTRTRASVGVGIVAALPVGRLEVNWCHVLRAQETDAVKRGLQVLLTANMG